MAELVRIQSDKARDKVSSAHAARETIMLSARVLLNALGGETGVGPGSAQLVTLLNSPPDERSVGMSNGASKDFAKENAELLHRDIRNG